MGMNECYESTLLSKPENYIKTIKDLFDNGLKRDEGVKKFGKEVKKEICLGKQQRKSVAIDCVNKGFTIEDIPNPRRENNIHSTSKSICGMIKFENNC
ncbi:hypothetical protein Glove_185g73 [Diversispora epigaea]|uniref:Uncharacterized protein n=1 Tax=Diversispora epigaea TaxID=1348612 RepID=A0A397IMI8_9GLOM|nr:hypothetical protein Glove_185g73 [Diversispora epigaea]